MPRCAVRLLAAASSLAVAATLTTTAASAAEPVTTAADGDQARLARALTVDGILTHERALNRIARNNDGNRASGTPGYDGSVRYVADKLRDAGYDVRTPVFRYVLFSETEVPEFARVSPRPETYEAGVDFFTMTYSGSGDLTGRVVPTNDVLVPPPAVPGSTSGCELADFPSPPAADSIALIQRGTCTFEQKVLNAVEAGYAAAIIFNEGQEGRTELLTGTLGNPVPIPVVGTTFALGEELVTIARARTVTASLNVQTLNEPGRSTNVVAEFPSGRGDRVVLVGAHLDSVEEGPGINDNGSGTSTILEIALQMRRLNLRTLNRVRFAFWGAEENGLVGSQAYVAALTEQQASRIDLNLNFDMLGSPNYVRFVYDGDGSATPGVDDEGPAGSDEIERAFQSYFGARNLDTDPTAFDGRSDYAAFTAVGIPAGGLFSGAEGIKTPRQARIYGGEAGAPYDPCYHEACDNLSNLSNDALDEHGDAAAHVTLRFANRKEPIGAPAATARAAAASAQTGYLYRGNRLQR